MQCQSQITVVNDFLEKRNQPTINLVSQRVINETVCVMGGESTIAYNRDIDAHSFVALKSALHRLCRSDSYASDIVVLMKKMMERVEMFVF